MQQYTLLQLICKVYVEAMHISAYKNWGVGRYTIDELTESIINIPRKFFIESLDKFSDYF